MAFCLTMYPRQFAQYSGANEVKRFTVSNIPAPQGYVKNRLAGFPATPAAADHPAGSAGRGTILQCV